MESELESKCLYCSQLVSSLEKVNKTSDGLSSEFHGVKLQAEEQYKKLKVEHKALQQGQARKGILLEQIRLLKSANREKLRTMKAIHQRLLIHCLGLKRRTPSFKVNYQSAWRGHRQNLGIFKTKYFSLGTNLKSLNAWHQISKSSVIKLL